MSGQAASDEKQFPPVPDWQPSFSAPIENQLERMVYYTDRKRDLAVFKHGTVVVLEADMNDVAAKEYALKVLSDIYNYHPDMNPLNMDDGNIMVQYNHPAYNVVITKFIEEHLNVIRSKHLQALATDEVIITGAGSNKFDDFGMKALYGRTFMFMDAQSPEIVQVFRHKSSNKPLIATPKSGAQ